MDGVAARPEMSPQRWRFAEPPRQAEATIGMEKTGSFAVTRRR
jgi:hypothetical protein